MRRWSLAEWPGHGLVQSISVDMQSCSAAVLHTLQLTTALLTSNLINHPASSHSTHQWQFLQKRMKFTIFGFLAAKAAQ